MSTPKCTQAVTVWCSCPSEDPERTPVASRLKRPGVLLSKSGRGRRLVDRNSERAGSDAYKDSVACLQSRDFETAGGPMGGQPGSAANQRPDRTPSAGGVSHPVEWPPPSLSHPFCSPSPFCHIVGLSAFCALLQLSKRRCMLTIAVSLCEPFPSNSNFN